PRAASGGTAAPSSGAVEATCHPSERPETIRSDSAGPDCSWVSRPAKSVPTQPGELPAAGSGHASTTRAKARLLTLTGSHPLSPFSVSGAVGVGRPSPEVSDTERGCADGSNPGGAFVL